MLPTSRKNRTRLPLAEMSIFSVALEPLKSIVSKPACPSTVSLPSPGFQTKVSSPAPMRATSLPRPPIDQVVALAADEDVVAVAAVEGQGDRIRLETARVDGVVAREGVDRELVARRFAPRDVHRGGQARDRDAGRRAGNRDAGRRRWCR